jgi:hypothetical protein
VYCSVNVGLNLGFGLMLGILSAVTHTILKLVIGSNKLICHSSNGGQRQGYFCHNRIEDALIFYLMGVDCWGMRATSSLSVKNHLVFVGINAQKFYWVISTSLSTFIFSLILNVLIKLLIHTVFLSHTTLSNCPNQSLNKYRKDFVE